MGPAVLILIGTLIAAAIAATMVVRRGGWPLLRKRGPILIVIVVVLAAFAVVVGAATMDPFLRVVVIFAEAVGVAVLWFFVLRGKLPIGHALVGTIGLLLTVIPPN